MRRTCAPLPEPPGCWSGRPAWWSSRCWPIISSETACAMPPIPMRPEEAAVQDLMEFQRGKQATDDADVVLRVENLSLDFNLRTQILHAARNVSFDLKRGKTLCLVGESGSGKSVTARAVLRIVDKNGTVSSGRILLRDSKGEID